MSQLKLFGFNKNVSALFVATALLVSFQCFGGGHVADGKLAARNQPTTHQVNIVRKLNKLLGMVKDVNGAISLSPKEYRTLIFDPLRNHTTFVLFFNDQHSCDSCGTIQNAFDRIASAFLQTNTKYDVETKTWNMIAPVFFVKVTMAEGYKKMLVDLDPAYPSVYYFAPSVSLKYNQFERIDQQNLDTSVDGFSINRIGWSKMPAFGSITVPSKKQSSGMTQSLIAVVSLGFMILVNMYIFGFWDGFVECILQCNFSYFITVVVVWLLSGQMYNYIRYTPMMGNYGINMASLIYPGMRSQYGCESIIIMVLYGLIIYGVIQLIESRERQLSEHLTNLEVQSAVLGGLSCVYFGFMSLQYFSKMKTGG